VIRLERPLGSARCFGCHKEYVHSLNETFLTVKYDGIYVNNF